ncbi:MAG: hypothetical protein CMD33_01415 [Flavobacteriales bacterium]|nr:hypothetical protein [Flavobacteriales bacterium]
MNLGYIDFPHAISATMKMSKLFYYLQLLILAVFISSCGQDEEHSELFDFDLNNGISLESTNEFLQLSMSYVDTLYQWDTVHLNLNDGAAGDSLVTGCGNWNYEVNPTTTVELWFTDTWVEDGIYGFSSDVVANDFGIIIRKDLIFGPAYEFGNFIVENAMISQNTLARGFTNVSDSEPSKVANAYMKLEHWNTSDQMMRFVLELQNGDVVRGSYSGMFQPFRRIEYDSDCD